ncbi:hypothetical protein RJ639_011735 [Escallonia herrerae]|uniref:Uncharacterized protein n=1 Tax=Escallonia herrerae TaxID=1293975 RepID=A0AA88VLG2_9ASTE|nr:hypothetical protein RJ639_011735 [Escallonia herrerae]
MALQVVFSPSLVSTARLASLRSSKHPHSNTYTVSSIRCIATTTTTDNTAENRRSANYLPRVWDYDFVQSFNSDYNVQTETQCRVYVFGKEYDVNLGITFIVVQDEKFIGQVDKVKEDVKCLIDGVMEVPLAKLELIDTVQRLGLKYHFEKEIKKALDLVYNNDSNNGYFDDSLYATALRFRLLRQHGYDVAQDVFERFMDDKGSFKAGLCGDVKGLLSLYEASFFGFEGERIIDEAKTFATTRLEDIKGDISPSLARKCNGIVSEPQYGAFRDMATKIICLITTIDDIYDVYGSMEELELFTDCVDRWDISEIDKLPLSIRTVLLALYNTSNEIGYWTLKERGFNIIPYLSKTWADLCKAYFKEAGWFHGGYKPTLDEYLDNAVVSIAAPLMLFCSYFLTTNNITEEALNYIDKLPSIMRCSCLLIRLTNDLGTSTDELERGDNLKSVQCYMNETGATEEEARAYINGFVHETWKIMNKDLLESYPFSEPFLSANSNLGRTAQCFYQYGDGHGVPDRWTKDHLTALLVQPIHMNYKNSLLLYIWDISEIDKLPLSIRIVLLALYNNTNEIGYWTLKERGFNIIPYLNKTWADLCKAYFKEAGWFHGGYKPTLDEYLDNAVVSIVAPLMLFCSYFLTTNNITEEALNYIDKLPCIMRCSCLLIPLTNDLVTSSDELERGDNLKSVQCYMNETGATEEEACAYINGVVHKTWKIMNKDLLGNYPFSEPFECQP